MELEDGYHGSMISFHNLFYEVPDSGRCCSKAATKTVIQNISGLFKPGTMNAIMGPTGSGKSSLLDILAARKDPSGLTGTVLVDGHPQPPNFRLMSGYVVQDDVVMGTLSIRENLRFSADLRLPKNFSSEDKDTRVDQVCSELGLDLCADTRVGDEFTRGVSGGERKRCNVGMEMIIAPGVLFLDEPTTGLDASTANSVMANLRRLAQKGSTIIFSIHQPRYSIFKLFDSLCLLGNGQTIYHGPANQALDYFNSIGYQIEEHDNPADFFLDVILGSIESNKGNYQNDTAITQGESQSGTVINIPEPSNPQQQTGENGERLRLRSEHLSKQFADSAWGKTLQEKLKLLKDQVNGSSEELPVKKSSVDPSYNSNPCVQFLVLSRRSLKNILRDPRTSTIQMMNTLVFALITGAIYFNVPEDCKAGIQNRVGAFFFMCMNTVFGNLSGIDLFINERKIFIHENVSGFYRVSSYFFAKLLCDIIPNRSLPTLLFSLVVYWMIGLVNAVPNYFFFLLILIALSLAGTSIAFLASASTRTAAVATIICGLIFVIQMLFSGLLVNLDSLGAWISWLKYLSIFRYALQALLINEFRDLDFYVSGTNSTENCVKGSKTSYLEEQGISYETAWDLWQNVLALLCFAVGFLTFTYVQLRKIKKLT